MRTLSVGIVGFGNVGQELVRRLGSSSLPEIRLTGISSRDLGKTRLLVATACPNLAVVELDELIAESEVIVECATASALPEIARAVLASGKSLVCVSAGGLTETGELEDLSRKHGGRIRIANGALPSLDILRAVAETDVASVHLNSVIRPESLFGEPAAIAIGFDFQREYPKEKVRVFEGTARQAAELFPRHMNIAVSISIAGIGLDRTTLDLWADPTVTGARNTLDIASEVATITATIQNVPSKTNKKTSAIVAPSIIAALRSFVAPITAGG